MIILVEVTNSNWNLILHELIVMSKIAESVSREDKGQSISLMAA